MNKMESISFLYFFISEAISGKYPELTSEEISNLIKKCYKNFSNISTLEELVSNCKDINRAQDDINNQVIALLALDKFIDAKQFKKHPMRFIHEMVYAKLSNEMKREKNHVSDYTGLLTEVSEINARFQELESLVCTLRNLPVHSPNMAAPLLAYVFAAIIRIHFFKDGNGRLARFTVQYLLRSWGAPYLALPKVRNDTVWKAALSNALNGEMEALSEFLEKRLIDAWRET